MKYRYVLAAGIACGVSLAAQAAPHRSISVEVDNFSSPTISIPIAITVAGGAVPLTGTLSATVASPITNLVPGQAQAREIKLTNVGNVTYSSLSLLVKAASTPLVASNNGLTLTVLACDTTWVASGSTATCSSGEQTLIVQSPLNQLNGQTLSLTNSGSSTTCSLSVCTPKGVSNLLLVVALPSSAPQSLEGLSSNITFSLAGVGA